MEWSGPLEEGETLKSRQTKPGKSPIFLATRTGPGTGKSTAAHSWTAAVSETINSQHIILTASLKR